MKLASPFLPLSLVLLGVVGAVALWVALPPEQVMRVIAEDGPIELPTAVLYLLLVVALLLPPSVDLRLRLALAVSFATFAAREFDLHKHWTEKSVLKVSFYLGDAPLHQKLVAASVLALIAVSVLYLLRRHALATWRAFRAGHPVAVTIAWFMATIVVSKVLDRSVNLLIEDAGVPVGASMHALVSAVEEVSELVLPLLGGLALLQHVGGAGAARRRG
jgi:hypothetical protein